jgi:multidrug resistance efflux pump
VVVENGHTEPGSIVGGRIRGKVGRLASASRWLVGGLGLAGTLIYIVWIGGPYLRSIIVRDAAVTTWISIVPAPISGYTTDLLYPGDRVGEDGRIAKVDNPLADRTPLARAQGELDHAQAQLAAQRDLVERLQRILDARTASAAAYAATFKRDLDIIIRSADSNSALVAQRLEIERADENRKMILARTGAGSQMALGAATAAVTDHEKALTDIHSVLSRATSRRQAAELGVFMLDDGTDTGTAMRSVDDARMAREQAQAVLTGEEANVAAARTVVEAARLAYAKQRSRDVRVPPGTLAWSAISAPGAAVQPGSPVASWVDCRILMVDVPVSDVELSLLRKGAPADIVIEGERDVRRGTVFLLRGAAATVGTADLAALAKGRRPNIGQVLVRLEATPQDIETCPIGHAASVDFPDVGIVDIIRARLRL